jgi:hypothetical protein
VTEQLKLIAFLLLLSSFNYSSIFPSFPDFKQLLINITSVSMFVLVKNTSGIEVVINNSCCCLVDLLWRR